MGVDVGFVPELKLRESQWFGKRKRDLFRALDLVSNYYQSSSSFLGRGDVNLAWFAQHGMQHIRSF